MSWMIGILVIALLFYCVSLMIISYNLNKSYDELEKLYWLIFERNVELTVSNNDLNNLLAEYVDNYGELNVKKE